jgi:hypothetical protein
MNGLGMTDLEEEAKYKDAPSLALPLKRQQRFRFWIGRDNRRC